MGIFKPLNQRVINSNFFQPLNIFLHIFLISSVIYTVYISLNYYSALPLGGLKRAAGIFRLFALNTITVVDLISLILLLVKRGSIITYLIIFVMLLAVTIQILLSQFNIIILILFVLKSLPCLIVMIANKRIEPSKINSAV